MPDTARQLLPLPRVVVRERTVEASGRLGEFVRRQAAWEMSQAEGHGYVVKSFSMFYKTSKAYVLQGVKLLKDVRNCKCGAELW